MGRWVPLFRIAFNVYEAELSREGVWRVVDCQLPELTAEFEDELNGLCPPGSRPHGPEYFPGDVCAQAACAVDLLGGEIVMHYLPSEESSRVIY